MINNSPPLLSLCCQKELFCIGDDDDNIEGDAMVEGVKEEYMREEGDVKEKR